MTRRVRRRERVGRVDRGSALVMTLVMVLISAMIAVPLLRYTATVAKQNQVVRQRTIHIEAVKGALRASLAQPKALFQACGSAGLTTGVLLGSASLTTPVETKCFKLSAQGAIDTANEIYGVASVQYGTSAPTGVTGTPTALGQGGAGRVYQVAYSHYNMGGETQKLADEFNKKFGDDLYTLSADHILLMLSQAMANAKSTDPVKVAAALEGLTVKSFNGEVTMRKTDHQLQQALYISVWQKADAKYPYSPEGTGMTLVPVFSAMFQAQSLSVALAGTTSDQFTEHTSLVQMVSTPSGNMSLMSGVPSAVVATSGTWVMPSSPQISAVPSSVPNRMMSGRGDRWVQLSMALRWITAKMPRNALGVERIVRQGASPGSGGTAQAVEATGAWLAWYHS